MKIGNRSHLVEFWHRAENGPIMFEDDFDKKWFWPKLRDITKKYEIKYDPMKQVPVDDDLIDRTWKAACELVTSVGCLCVDTRRLIEFTQADIDKMVKQLPGQVTVGLGKDEITMYHRDIEQYDAVQNPTCVLGRILGPASMEAYWPIALSYAREGRMDMCHFQGNLTAIYGENIVPNSPWEMLSELWSIAQIKDACRQACRPGLADGGIRTISHAAQQSIRDEGWGMNKGDFRCCLMLPHNKVEYIHLQRALQYHTFGCKFYSVMTSYPGGLSGGPAHSAVVGTAEWILEKLLFDVQLNGSWSADAIYFSNTSKYALWCSNLQNAAVTKNTNTEPLVGGGYQMTTGVGHENFLWESAASAISATVLGNGISGGTGCQSGYEDHQIGAGLTFSCDVAEAVADAKLTRVQANDLVCRIQAKYQPYIDNKTAHKMGCDFKGCYDLKTVEPLKWYSDMIDKVKKELTQMGLPMAY